MKLELPARLNRQQWLRRMGVKGDAPIELLMQMAEVEDKLLAAAMPQGIYRIVPVEALDLYGNSIRRHLRKCSEVAIMGVTLGVMVDKLIRQYQIRDMAEALILDCGASVMVERLCDDLESEIRQHTDLYMTDRFSPGYGDYPLHTQADLIWQMDAHRKIGLTVNEKYILTPQKSVTGIIGLSEFPVTGDLAGCDECLIREECELRKEGLTCG